MPSTAHIDAFDQLASIPCAADPSAEIGKGENDVFKDVAPGPYSITQATRVDLAGKRHICGYLSISHGSIDAGVKATDDKPYEVTAAASTTTPAHKKHAKKCKKK